MKNEKLTCISPDDKTFFGSSNFCNFVVGSEARLMNTDTDGLLRFAGLLAFLDTGSNETLGGNALGSMGGFGCAGVIVTLDEGSLVIPMLVRVSAVDPNCLDNNTAVKIKVHFNFVKLKGTLKVLLWEGSAASAL
jgi:hypothetical protein